MRYWKGISEEFKELATHVALVVFMQIGSEEAT